MIGSIDLYLPGRYPVRQNPNVINKIERMGKLGVISKKRSRPQISKQNEARFTPISFSPS